jgi:hypothetical protein
VSWSSGSVRPSISYSGACQPATIFNPARPWLTWSAVASCLAATTGWWKAVCTVLNTLMRLVLASSPVAHTSGSRTLAWKSVSGPQFVHRATGSRKSMPTSSASCAKRRLFSQVAAQRSGTVVIARPDSVFGEKSPS